MPNLLTYAYNEQKHLVQVNGVPNGLECKCTCPLCGAILEAKNMGVERVHHFAHANGYNCEGAYETSLHILAKELICKNKGIMLPASKDATKPSGFVSLDDVRVEPFYKEYGIKPDVVGVLPNGAELFIEFEVTHKVNQKKRDVIVNNNILCIEIKLLWSELEEQQLSTFLVEETKDREWIDELIKKSNDSSVKTIQGELSQHLKRLFDTRSLIIRVPIYEEYAHIDDDYFFYYYDLKDYEYDTCVLSPNCISEGHKPDLKLFRSTKEEYNQGCIYIFIRGAKCNPAKYHSINRRVIEIVYSRSIVDRPLIQEKFRDLLLKDKEGFTVNYFNFKKQKERRGMY